MDSRKLIRSFTYAWRGLVRIFREEPNFRLETAAAAAVLVLMFVFDLSSAERGILALATVLVLVLELMNSVYERLADLLKPRLHHYVEDIKDIMAASVLVAAIGSVVIGLVIFWPPVSALFR
ncbi:MAG: diacylglycerol kinase [Patescibacteria group bacterium]|nr:diacylglycerol kinase [Patescibacteria group bacterium]